MDTLIFIAVTACIVCVGVNVALVFQAARYRRAVLDAHRLLEDMAALHDRFDSLSRLVKRIVARDNMREYRERQSDSSSSSSSKPRGGSPDWQRDPQGFIRHHEAKLGIASKFTGEKK